MSDPGRKDISTKTKEGLMPNIFKSRGKKMAESATDSADRAAREAQPDTIKSAPQSTADKFGRVKDRILHRGSGRKTGHESRRLFGRKRSPKATL